jgi:NADH-quinone oxidoreductase subunit N
VNIPLLPLLPLIVLTAAPVLIMLLLCILRSHRLTFGVTLAGILAGGTAVILATRAVPSRVTPLFFIDGFALYCSGLILAAGLVVTFMSYEYLRKRGPGAEEYYILLLVALLGGLVVVSSSHFASFFLGFEILSISLYPLIAFYRAMPLTTEAGIKYLILSAASSSFMLFGMALLYAVTGTLELSSLALRIADLAADDPMLLAGMILFLTGIGFKIALVPFHMWVADVYEGAPAPVAALIATVSKGAMFAFLLRYFTYTKLENIPSLFVVFTVLAVVSMFVGNLLALFQNNVKRLLAYSSISQFGYLLVALMASGSLRVRAVSFYLAAYFLTTLGAFAVVTALSAKERDADAIRDYAGLSQKHPLIAGTFALMLLSLAGMPLTVGFLGKVYVVTTGLSALLWLLVIVLIVNSTISLFYYLRVIFAMYEPRAASDSAAVVSPAFKIRLLLFVLLVLLIWWGVYPQPLMSVIEMVKIGQ